MLNYAGGNPITAYNLTRSLRFRRSASAWLSRTPASTTNQKTFTFSTWLKRGQLGVGQTIFNAGTYAQYGAFTTVGFDPADTISVVSGVWAVSTDFTLVTGAVFRDPSAWYHVVLQVDTTQATASNRIRVYVNNVLQTFASGSQPTQNLNTAINANIIHGIGAPNGSGSIFDGYLAETYFLDGQALTPSSFGSFNSTTGVWQPARYTGTYGTNGFYLPFTDNSSLTTSSNVGLGKDFSGNGNYWTTNNISITAGVTYDSMTDVPTLTSATAANYCVLNPLNNSQAVPKNGNLYIEYNGFLGSVTGTIGVSSGKYYWEVAVTYLSSSVIGIYRFDTPITSAFGANAYGYSYNGSKRTNSTDSAYGATYTTNDIIGVAFDATNGTIEFYKNNVSQGVAFTGITGGLFFPALVTNQATLQANFGQRPFAYTPPTGFVALNAYNLPDSTIKQGSTAMNIALDTGANIKATTEALFSGSQFLEFIKDRANANNWQWMNSLRGLSAVLQSNTTAAETTYTAPTGNSVGYALKMGSSGVTNTNGTVTSTVSVNASAGMSMGTFTVPASGLFTVGHGLGVAPKFVIAKATNSVYAWVCYHIGATANNYLVLSATAAATANSGAWGNTAPTSSVITFGDAAFWQAGANYVFYAFAEVSGFSSIGSYQGNGSADGPFIYQNQLSRFSLIKNISAAESWNLHDTARSPYNQDNNTLFPNDSAAEYTGTVDAIDDVSNGLKIRNTGTQSNQSGATMIYVSFAENPFRYALAR